MGFIKRHKWLFTILSIIFIGLPQWIDSAWSLAERITGRNITMPNIMWGYWITIPLGIIMFAITIWAVRSKKTTAVEIAHKSENLTDTLTMMNRRLVELQKEKASHTRVSIKQLERASGTFLDKLELVPLRDKPKFMQEVKRQIQQGLPKPPSRYLFNFVEWAKFRQMAWPASPAEVKPESGD